MICVTGVRHMLLVLPGNRLPMQQDPLFVQLKLTIHLR